MVRKRKKKRLSKKYSLDWHQAPAIRDKKTGRFKGRLDLDAYYGIRKPKQKRKR